MNRLRVCHVIGSLERGGTPVMMAKLVSRLRRSHVDCHVVTLLDRGSLGQELRQQGIPVMSLEMRRSFETPAVAFRLARLLSQLRPDVVQTWMYYSDLIGGVASKLVRPRLPVFWNIRTNALIQDSSNASQLFSARLCARLSHHVPARIVVNSADGMDWHSRLGYARQRMVLIRNGFEMDRFRPSRMARRVLRRQLEVDQDTPLVGMMSRFCPEKDHETFFRAAAEIARQHPATHFVLAGLDVTWHNERLRTLIRQAGLASQVHLLGLRRDMPVIQAALDVAVLASKVEGFPNTVGEAMACGVPCVVTDVGDSAEVVGEAGFVVPQRAARALADRCLDVLRMTDDDRISLGLQARRRIEQLFNLETIAHQYTELWRDALVSTTACQQQLPDAA